MCWAGQSQPKSWRARGTGTGRNSWSDLGEEEGRLQSGPYWSQAPGEDFSRLRNAKGMTKVIKMQAGFGDIKRL